MSRSLGRNRLVEDHPRTRRLLEFLVPFLDALDPLVVVREETAALLACLGGQASTSRARLSLMDPIGSRCRRATRRGCIGRRVRGRGVEMSPRVGHPGMPHELLGRYTQVRVLLKACEEEVLDNLFERSSMRQPGRAGETKRETTDLGRAQWDGRGVVLNDAEEGLHRLERVMWRLALQKLDDDAADAPGVAHKSQKTSK